MEPFVPSTPNFKLDYQGNFLELSLAQGAKIISLKLKDPSGSLHSVIEGSNSPDSFTSNGSFLMYPWVNRLEPLEISKQPEIKVTPLICDGAGIALHGMFAGSEREVVEQGSNFVVLRVKDLEKIREKWEFLRHFPEFTESFILGEASLSVLTEFSYDQAKETMGFSYGYHPYIQLDDTSIDEAQIQSNLTHFVQKTDRNVPVQGPDSEYVLSDITELLGDGLLKGDVQLDHGLVRKSGDLETSFRLIFKGKGLEVLINDSVDFLAKREEQFKELVQEKEKIPLNYFQVYTPPGRKSLAVEPQSSGANVFHVGRKELRTIKPGEPGKYGIFNIILREHKN